MPILTIHFVRHAPVLPEPKDKIYGRDVPFDLSCTELFQKASDELPSPDNTPWFSSPFPRAIATAKEILRLKNTNYTPVIIDDFQEQNFGKFTDKTKSSLRNDAIFQNFIQNPLYANIPSGETGENFNQRVSSAIKTHLKSMKNGNHDASVVVCHGGVIKNAYFYGRPLPKNPKDLLSINTPYVSVHPIKFNVD